MNFIGMSDQRALLVRWAKLMLYDFVFRAGEEGWSEPDLWEEVAEETVKEKIAELKE